MLDTCLLQSFAFPHSLWEIGTCSNRRLCSSLNLEWIEIAYVFCVVFLPPVYWCSFVPIWFISRVYAHPASFPATWPSAFIAICLNIYDDHKICRILSMCAPVHSRVEEWLWKINQMSPNLVQLLQIICNVYWASKMFVLHLHWIYKHIRDILLLTNCSYLISISVKWGFTWITNLSMSLVINEL